MEFQQSKTYANIQNSFERELMASTLYSIYSDRAEQDGYIEISSIYDTYVRNHKEHARIWFRRLHNGVIPDTQQNLLDSSTGELDRGDIYREYARVAREEGYNDIASLFNGIANIELNHNLTLSTLYDNVIGGEVFCKPNETLWICMQCGNIMSGTCAPEICPVCGFPQGYYRVYTNEA
jgi:rubrerythrin